MLNHIELLGRLAQDPELKTTTGGISKTTFDLAVPVPSKNKNTPPDYIPIVCWDKLAERVCNYLGKGRQIVVEGRLTTRKYTDNNGKNRKVIEVRASQIYFADSGNEANNPETGQSGAIPTAPQWSETGDDDDLPF